jgi:hypothetical protein
MKNDDMKIYCQKLAVVHTQLMPYLIYLNHYRVSGEHSFSKTAYWNKDQVANNRLFARCRMIKYQHLPLGL